MPGVSLAGKVALVTGSSRGIGRECVLALARRGCNVVVAAKSTKDTPNLPGTIHSVAAEAISIGVEALPVQMDLRDDSQISSGVDRVINKFGRVDILVNNASALWWQDITDTPMKKFDLINSINSRGSFAITQACLPHMERNSFGRVITMSPPISTNAAEYKGKTAYYMSKFGMTMVALGVSAEGRGKGITGNSLWPATIIESLAAINFQLGDPSMWRKASILADCVTNICEEGDEFTGNMLIDDAYLRSKGFTEEDLVQYRMDPTVEPPRILAGEDTEWTAGEFKRGDVKKLAEDKSKSKNLK
uniref:Hydroxysteroid dehydrogenase-like protein 2 n=1 Tax=Aplanochytrium stocchinoi TaxID=215587 RepID=A0A7S3V2V1_9STRA|mmetsp:Transcript_21151/g.25613  ORF Transcript_21151/g.25613 Transcript_21151/m.25613 type:complete len:304 (-) Transcript_21151:552-1463(-)|eukprot:CAMPEP_0204839328 /NCGR_PEP_ID=MMETSP1346-20131115/33787_1 /ASSEMBLY_ACC=CAM_ASM_000771 /TAXON_ID=215587 /ORGANISM="Aplanochytrium stocchinoi, Strain GSBS06" /LENGTH=303 /DNA_ID=CAMNT_0051975957 /DNA_START=166 /DNA_END=1077 /DNA_ORIENTATION=+